MSARAPGRILEVPDQYRAGLALIGELPEEAFGELQAALSRAPETGSRKELTAWLSPETKSFSQSDLPKVIDALTSLYRVKVSVGVPTERLAGDVATAMSETGPQDLRLAEGKRSVFIDRLSKLISLPSLNVADTKAQELKSEYEHTFCDSRIFTDLRPVFGSNISDPPSKMLIVHMLKLGYHDSNESRHKEFHLALDSKDLAELKEIIIRAETKAKTLKSQLESAGVKPIETE